MLILVFDARNRATTQTHFGLRHRSPQRLKSTFFEKNSSLWVPFWEWDHPLRENYKKNVDFSL